MPIEHAISEPDRIIEVRFIGDVSDDEYAKHYIKLAKDHPHAILYDEIIDMRAYTGSISNDSVNELAARLARRERPMTRATTIVVTHDSRIEMWAAFVQSKFPFRTYKAVRSIESAYRMLAEGRA